MGGAIFCHLRIVVELTEGTGCVLRVAFSTRSSFLETKNIHSHIFDLILIPASPLQSDIDLSIVS